MTDKLIQIYGPDQASSEAVQRFFQNFFPDNAYRASSPDPRQVMQDWFSATSQPRTLYVVSRDGKQVSLDTTIMDRGFLLEDIDILTSDSVDPRDFVGKEYSFADVPYQVLPTIVSVRGFNNEGVSFDPTVSWYEDVILKNRSRDAMILLPRIHFGQIPENLVWRLEKEYNE